MEFLGKANIKRGNNMYTWKPYADKIIFNANIYTVDLTIPEIQNGKTDFKIFKNGFVAIKENKIIATGDGDGKEYAGSDTELIDVNGATVIPGLMDSHMHALFAGIALSAVAMEKCTCLNDMLDGIKKRAEETDDESWIIGTAWNELAWNDGLKPDAKLLDTVSKNHPVATKRICGHVLVANTKAMELAGITKDTPDPAGGKIGRNDDGTPNGWFFEQAAFSLIENVQPQETEESLVDAIKNIGAYINKVGITSVIDCNLPYEHTRAYLQALKQNKLTYRANVTFYLDKAEGNAEYHLNRMDQMMAVTGFGNPMLKFNGVKILLDGVPAMGTAYMRQNYKYMPETRGFTTFSQDELNAICEKAASQKWQMAIHAIGDAAMDSVLEAYNKASEKYDTTENRNYIIHAVFPHDDQLPLFKKLNVPVTVQPTIMGVMGEESCLREEEADNNQPAGWYFKNGIICGGSSDFSVVDCNPFLGMSKAITRKCLDGKVHGKEHCVTPAQALIMWTMASAYISHDEEKLGSIIPGKIADLVVIDTPILESTAEQIEKTKVLLTMVNGKIVYK